MKMETYDMRGNGDGKTVGTLTGDHAGRPTDYTPVVAFSCKDNGRDAGNEIAPCLRSMGGKRSDGSNGDSGGGQVAVAMMRESVQGFWTADEIAGTLRAEGENRPSRPSNVIATQIQGESYGSEYQADASSFLSTLRKTVGEETYAEWGLNVIASFRSPEVLQSWLYGESLYDASEDFKSFMDDRALSCPQVMSNNGLRVVWINGPDGCTPQGRGLAKQLAGKPDCPLSVMSHQTTQDEKSLRLVRSADEGAGLLRKALSEIQEVRQSIDVQTQSTQSSCCVRRLVPTECEALQALPRNWTAIPRKGKTAEECPDGPRYKGIGNGQTVSVMEWLARRIKRELERETV